MNFDARISLSASLWFGALGIIMLYVIMPLYRRLIGIRNQTVVNLIAWPTITLFLIDVLARIPLGSNYVA